MMNLTVAKWRALERESSMFYWFPRLVGDWQLGTQHEIASFPWAETPIKIGIPMPRTCLIPVAEALLHAIGNEEDVNFETTVLRVAGAIRDLKHLAGAAWAGAFLRTDQASAKFQWRETCYLSPEDCENKDRIRQHIRELCIWNECAEMPLGLPMQGLVVREFVPLAARFKTDVWYDLPIAPERRYFIRHDKPDKFEVVCHHAYWIRESILAGQAAPDHPDWEQLLEAMNTESPAEVEQLSFYARQVAHLFRGFWCVDFALAQDGRWTLIDMARGELAWHPETCPHAVKVKVIHE
jgi:hypothetical protein